MQRQGGGGNDPSCGCDMRAGWPPAFLQPQQGGKITSFHLNLKQNNGPNLSYNGRLRGSRPNTALPKEEEEEEEDIVENVIGEEPMSMAMAAEAMANENLNVMNTNPMNMNNNNNMNMNNNMNNSNQNNNQNNNNQNNNNQNNNNNNNNNNGRRKTLKKVRFENKNYFEDPKTGEAFVRTKNGKKGEYRGRFLEVNGKRVLNTSIPASGAEPPEIETMGVGSETANKPLSLRGGGVPPCGSCPFPGTGACDFYAKGGGCACGNYRQTGGGCPCSAGLGLFQGGGYRATRRNKKYLKRWKQGKSIGFTMTASLKAKGLIPRTSRTMKGKKVVGRKYK